MHRFVSAGSSPSAADPGGGAGGSGAAASAAAATPGGSAEQQQQPAAPAAHSADDNVQVVNTTSRLCWGGFQFSSLRKGFGEQNRHPNEDACAGTSSCDLCAV